MVWYERREQRLYIQLGQFSYVRVPQERALLLHDCTPNRRGMTSMTPRPLYGFGFFNQRILTRSFRFELDFTTVPVHAELDFAACTKHE